MTHDTSGGRPRPTDVETARSDQGQKPRWSGTRLIAVLLLIPSIPMLLGSVGALALFYVAPVRFGGLIARLPGDEFIQTVLFFAPATLFAVVVLAFLYAREPGPAVALTPSQVSAVRSTPAQSVARWALGLITPAFLVAVLVLLLSLVAPGRFSRWIEPLPGDRFLRPLVTAAPLLLLVVGVFSVLVAFPRRRAQPPAAAAGRWARLARRAVGLILLSTVPMLVLSLLALGTSYLEPERFQRLMNRLDPDAFLRLALLFAPAILAAVVILALLYLIGRTSGEPAHLVATAETQARAAERRSTLGVSILVSGLVLSTIVALGLLAVLVILLLR